MKFGGWQVGLILMVAMEVCMLRRALCLLVALVAVSLVLVAPAEAQPMRMGGMGGGDMFEPPVSSRDVERYVKFLSLAEDQGEAAKALLEGYQVEFERQAKVMREASDAAREEFRETRDPSVWQDLMPKFEEFRKTREKSAQGFMNDMKALLTEEQAAKWPRVERMRRRDATMRRGFVSGESVDVIRLLDEFKASDEQKAAMQPVLEQYEAELDKALVERNELYDAAMNQGMGMWRQGDFAGMDEMLKKGREAAMRVRDINRKYARQLQGMLPEEEQSRFDSVFRERSFPRVYRPTYASRAMEIVGGFEDLTEDQKSRVGELRATFEREVGTINKRWAEAVEESEQNMSVRDLMGMGGGNEQVREARNQRRTLEERTLEQLKSVLTAEQIKKLPDRRGREDEEGERRGG